MDDVIGSSLGQSGRPAAAEPEIQRSTVLQEKAKEERTVTYRSPHSAQHNGAFKETRTVCAAAQWPDSRCVFKSTELCIVM